jgi:hypothetical protein
MSDERMIPANRLDVPVLVERDGQWHEGWIEHRRQIAGVWQAWVRYSTAPGYSYVDWVTYDRLRPLPNDPVDP